MNMRNIVRWGLVAVVIAAALFALVRWQQRSAGEASMAAKERFSAVRADDHVKGDAEGAALTIIEYSDFQCPACAHAAPYFEGLAQAVPQGVRFVYRYFPLSLIHRNATEAARAAEAAARQGKFWAMHDMLFQKQDEWGERVDVEPLFADYAAALGLDRARFLADYNSADVKARVARDADEAKALGLSGTPSLFLNGEPMRLPQTKEQFYEALRARLAAMRQGTDTAAEDSVEVTLE